jgi:hypothetical protein
VKVGSDRHDNVSRTFGLFFGIAHLIARVRPWLYEHAHFVVQQNGAEEPFDSY